MVAAIILVAFNMIGHKWFLEHLHQSVAGSVAQDAVLWYLPITWWLELLIMAAPFGLVIASSRNLSARARKRAALVGVVIWIIGAGLAVRSGVTIIGDHVEITAIEPWVKTRELPLNAVFAVDRGCFGHGEKGDHVHALYRLRFAIPRIVAGRSVKSREMANFGYALGRMGVGAFTRALADLRAQMRSPLFHTTSANRSCISKLGFDLNYEEHRKLFAALDLRRFEGRLLPAQQQATGHTFVRWEPGVFYDPW